MGRSRLGLTNTNRKTERVYRHGLRHDAGTNRFLYVDDQHLPAITEYQLRSIPAHPCPEDRKDKERKSGAVSHDNINQFDNQLKYSRGDGCSHSGLSDRRRYGQKSITATPRIINCACTPLPANDAEGAKRMETDHSCHPMFL